MDVVEGHHPHQMGDGKTAHIATVQWGWAMGLTNNANKPPTPSGSELHNSIQAIYKPGTQPPLEIPMKDLAIWLGKYVRMMYICMTCLEGYATCSLSKTAHSNAAHIGKHLHKMAKSKDHLNHKKRWLKQLNDELSVLALTSQPSVTTNTAIAILPYDAEGSSTEAWPMPALYTDSDIHMGNIDDSITDDLYR